MRVEPLGESAYILRDLPAPAWKIARTIESLNIEDIHEAISAYDTVGVYVRPGAAIHNWSEIESHFKNIESAAQVRHHIIPTCYDLGEDLDEVAKTLGMRRNQVIDFHAYRPYECAAIGFCPGFPYLRSLPATLQGIPRRGSPRPRIEPGSVGITGAQTGIYPLVRPGGWALIGRTPLTIVDASTGYFPIEAGDSVTFIPITLAEFHDRVGERL